MIKDLLLTLTTLTVTACCVVQDLVEDPEQDAAANDADAPANATIQAVNGVGRATARLTITKSGEMEFELGDANDEHAMRYATSTDRPAGFRLARLISRGPMNEGGNVATVSKFSLGGNGEVWVWTDIESLSPSNLSHMKVQRTPYCVLQFANAAGIQAFPMDRIRSPHNERVLPPPPVPFRKGKLWGYRQFASRQVEIEPQFLHARKFGQHDRVDRAMVRTADGWGFIDRSGRLAIAADYHDFGGHFYGDQILAFKNGKCGVVDKDGKVLLTPKFLEARPFVGIKKELAPVRTKTGWGFVDRSGKQVIKAQFVGVGWFGEAGAPASDLSGKWGYIDRNGAWRIQPTFDRVQPHRDGFAVIRIDGKSGVIDVDGKLVIPAKYRNIYGYANGRWRARLGDKSGWLATDGTFLEQADDR